MESRYPEEMLSVENHLSDALADVLFFIHKEDVDAVEKEKFVSNYGEFVQSACEALKSEIHFKEVIKPRLVHSEEKNLRVLRQMKDKGKEEKPSIELKVGSTKEEKAAEEKRRRRNTIFYSTKNNRWEEIENPIKQEDESIDAESIEEEEKF